MCYVFPTSFKNVFKLEEILFVYCRICTGRTFHKPTNVNILKVSTVKTLEQFVAEVYLRSCQTFTMEPFYKKG